MNYMEITGINKSVLGFAFWMEHY